MAIFNETYTSSIITANEYDAEPVNEVAGEAAAIAFLATYTVALFGVVGAAIIKTKKDHDTIKEALKVYPKMNKGCVPLYKFKKKVCNIVPYSNKPGEESVPKTAYQKFMRKYKLDYANKCICYFDSNDKLVMYYCYRVNSSGSATNYKTSAFIVDEKYKKFKDYYFTFFLFNRKLCNNDTLEWAKKVMHEYTNSAVKEYESSDDEKGE